jgi:hypothetical protein
MGSPEIRDRPGDGFTDEPASKRVKLDAATAPVATDNESQKPPRVKGLASIKK